jgi:uncharacterized membrane protein
MTLSDLILGGQRSVVFRYLIPSYLGVQLAVAYLLSAQITSASKVWQQKLWQLIFAVLLSVGALSCVAISQAEVWWTKYQSSHYPQITQIINQAERPLLIGGHTHVLALIHELDPRTRLQLVVEDDIPEISQGFSDVFVYKPSETLKSELEKKYELQSIHQEGELWKLEKS